MANLVPIPGWDAVTELEILTPVLGGAGGPSNLQAQALLNRSEFLLQRMQGAGAASIDPMVLSARHNTTSGNNDWLSIVGATGTSITASANIANPIIYTVYNGVVNGAPSMPVVVLETAVTETSSGLPNGEYYIYFKYNPPTQPPVVNTSIKFVEKSRMQITSIPLVEDDSLHLIKGSGLWMETIGQNPAQQVGVCIIGEVTVTAGVFSGLRVYPVRTPFYNSTIPAGTLCDIATAEPPTGGWLRCDGSVYSRAQYADLFRSIGVTYGTTLATNFKVPDTRGRFVRDLSSGATLDAGRVIGSLQDDALKSHSHTIGLGSAILPIVTEAGTGTGDLEITSGTVNEYTSGQGDNTINPTGSVETRPVNIAFVKYIKF